MEEQKKAGEAVQAGREKPAKAEGETAAMERCERKQKQVCIC